MPGELHSHSTFSDGSLPAALLPQLAARAGLSWLAVSDHDTMYSVHFAYRQPVQAGVRLIPATELTAYDFERKHRVHLLCYWPDETCQELIDHCDRMARRRNEVGLRSAKELEAIYPQFKTEEAMALAHGGVLYKAAMMRVLCEYGLADGIYKESYKELFGPGVGKILHPPEYEPLDKVLDAMGKARAVVVLAHPSVYKSMPLAAQLAKEGRIDGVEIDHPRNTEEDKAALRALAAEYGLIATAGTDFHGMHAGRPRPLGLLQTPDGTIGRINALAQSRKGGAPLF